MNESFPNGTSSVQDRRNGQEIIPTNAHLCGKTSLDGDGLKGIKGSSVVDVSAGEFPSNIPTTKEYLALAYKHVEM